jgi:hypothetical protein
MVVSVTRVSGERLGSLRGGRTVNWEMDLNSY